MLASQPLTFSEILESLSIDSGHLSYHLENLGDLVTHSQDGKYGLSSIGNAAVKLMSGVEEHPAAPSRKESKLMLGVTNVYLLILVGALVAASLYFINFTASASYDAGKTWPGTTFLIGPGQTFEFNVTIVYKQTSEMSIWGNGSLYHERAPPVSALTIWERGWFWFELESNETYQILTTLLSPDGTMVTKRHDNLATGLLTVGFGTNEITLAGTYRFEIKNIGSQELHALLRVHEEWQSFEKPYLYYGIAGLLVTLLYPIFILFKLLKG